MSAGERSDRTGLLLMPEEIQSNSASGSEGDESMSKTDLVSSSASHSAAELPISAKC